MKYYSEILDKMFDTDTALKHAEEEKRLQEYNKKLQAEREQKNAVSKDKKAMADAIEKADKELAAAYKDLKDVRAEAAKIKKEADLKIVELYKPAKEKVAQAERNRIKAIKDFNAKYGVYSIALTGDKAEEEFERIFNMFNMFW